MDDGVVDEVAGDGPESHARAGVGRVLRGLRAAEAIGQQANRTLIQYLALLSQIVWVVLVCCTVAEAVRGRPSGWLVASAAGHTAAEVASRLPSRRSTQGAA